MQHENGKTPKDRDRHHIIIIYLELLPLTFIPYHSREKRKFLRGFSIWQAVAPNVIQCVFESIFCQHLISQIHGFNIIKLNVVTTSHFWLFDSLDSFSPSWNLISEMGCFEQRQCHSIFLSVWDTIS